MSAELPDVMAIKSCRAGQRITFRARVLRLWETGGERMALVGDESALTRVELGDAPVEEGASYRFQAALVRQYPSTSRSAGPGGWHSVSLGAESSVTRLGEDVPTAQSEEYIERTYRILAGIQRKKARREGRAEPWRHPARD